MDVTVPYWRKVWKTLASGSRPVPKELITNVLNEVGDDLCKGIKVYETPFEENECKSWLKSSDLKEFDDAFEKFFLRLCKAMNLRGESGWSVLCNYLLYEFHGKLSRIKQLATYEPFATKLVEAIWHFYSAERMYQLKTLRFILEHFSSFRYKEVFSDYMKRVTWKFLWGNVIGQLDYLITEINKFTVENTADMTAWVERNGHEQLEVVLIAVAAMGFDNFTVDDFIPLMTVLMKNDFGRISPHVTGIEFDQRVFLKLCCAEVGAFLVFLGNCWNNDSFWIRQKGELEKLISLASNSMGYEIIIFAWAVLQAELYLDDGAEFIRNYSKTFDILIKTDVLVRFYDFVRQVRTFNCNSGKMILKAVYDFMDSLCDAFNSQGFVSFHNGTYEVMRELLKDDDETCAAFLLETERPIHRILEFSRKFFPFNFKGLTWLMLTFVENGYSEKAIMALNELQTYTESYSGRLRDESTIFLRSDYYPVRHSKWLRIPEGTQATVFAKLNTTLLMYEVEYEYYCVVLSQLDCLTEQIQGTKTYRQETFEKVLLGYQLIAGILQSGVIKVSSVRNVLKHLTRVYHIFSQGQFRNLQVMDVFLQAVEGAMFCDAMDDERFWPGDFLPKLKSTALGDILHQYDVFGPSVLLDLLHADEQNDSHPLLFSYMAFVKRAFDEKMFHMEVQLPGIVYLLTRVFPKHKDYQYKDPLDGYRVANAVLEILWNVVKTDRRDIQDQDELLIFNFCLQSALMDSYILKGYCELFKTTLFTAQKLLEKETNWDTKDEIVINKFVTLFLRSFLVLIKHNQHLKTTTSDKTLFEHIVLRAPLERMNTVKVITAFADYTFDPEIQKMAVRILENMAQDPSFPMFGPMDLEPFQLQSFFLDKLRDPVEGDELKLAIIDLILTCVDHQPGLTNAFFNINVLATEEPDEGESVVNCMMDFLHNIEESKITLHHPLLCGVLAVIQKVWDTGSMHLIAKITELENFWATLVKPLHHELVADPKFYALIVGILSQEFLLSKDKVSEEFTEVIKKLLDVNGSFAAKWPAYLVKISSTIDGVADFDQYDVAAFTGDVLLLYAWKLFVSYGQMFCPQFFEAPRLRRTIVDTCLEALLSHFRATAVMACVRFWSELYTTCLSAWPADSFSSVAKMFSKMQQILSHLTVDYKVMVPSPKQAILTSVALMLKKFSGFAEENAEAIDDLLEPLGKIVRFEFHALADDIEIARTAEREDMPPSVSSWLLILSIANKVLLLKTAARHAYWFEECGFLAKVMWCVGPLIQSPNTLPFAKFAMKSLIIYSQSPFSHGLLRVNKNNFFKETAPPLEYVHPPLKTPRIMREWWVTYAEIIKLVNFLVLKFRYAITADILAFVNFHDDTIIATLELARLTADPAALNLICGVLMFCNNMLHWRGRWITNKENYFGRTVQAIRNCVSGVCNLILRPKSLAFVSVHNFESFIPNSEIQEDVYLDIYNMVLEAISLGIRFFIECQPPLLFYSASPEHQYVVIELEKDFHFPRYNVPELNIFTYGGLLCILQFLCKAHAKITDGKRKPTEQRRMLLRRVLRDVPSVEKLVTLRETIDTPTKRLEPHLAIILTETDADLLHEFVTAIQRFSSTYFNLFDTPWFPKISAETVQMALEVLAYFVVLEFAADLHSPNISVQMKQYMQREVGAEMQAFSDFVRRNMQEQMESTKVEHNSPRKQAELERLSTYMTNLLGKKDCQFHGEFLWVLNHVVQDFCQLEDES